MDYTNIYKQIIDTLNEREYVSILSVQKEYNIGFCTSGKIVAILISNGYLSFHCTKKGYKVLKKDTNIEC